MWRSRSLPRMPRRNGDTCSCPSIGLVLHIRTFVLPSLVDARWTSLLGELTSSKRCIYIRSSNFTPVTRLQPPSSHKSPRARRTALPTPRAPLRAATIGSVQAIALAIQVLMALHLAISRRNGNPFCSNLRPAGRYDRDAQVRTIPH